MDWNGIIQGVTQFFNSSFGFALIWAGVVGLFIWLASRYNPFQEKWKEWEGSIITGIKLAEKNIPDDTPNAGLAKIVEQIRQGIQIKHSDLDRFGGLSKPKEAHL